MHAEIDNGAEIVVAVRKQMNSKPFAGEKKKKQNHRRSLRVHLPTNDIDLFDYPSYFVIVIVAFDGILLFKEAKHANCGLPSFHTPDLIYHVKPASKIRYSKA